MNIKWKELGGTVIFGNRTSNGIPPIAVEREAWLRRSKQNHRHPLSPLGVCMDCGDHKIGHWQWVSDEPE